MEALHTGRKRAMSAAERVRLSRWVNRVEATADELLELLETGPRPLPRKPVLDPKLVDMLASLTLDQDDPDEADYPRVRFLTPGNGNQVRNKRRAMLCALRVLNAARQVDHRTIRLPRWGTCHFAAYTHAKGAMISSTRREDNSYGSANWHKRDHIVMFRDAGDGRCIVYICAIEPLFERRTIGHHGVRWEDVEKLAELSKVIASKDALAAERD